MDYRFGRAACWHSLFHRINAARMTTFIRSPRSELSLRRILWQQSGAVANSFDSSETRSRHPGSFGCGAVCVAIFWFLWDDLQIRGICVPLAAQATPAWFALESDAGTPGSPRAHHVRKQPPGVTPHRNGFTDWNDRWGRLQILRPLPLCRSYGRPTEAV